MICPHCYHFQFVHKLTDCESILILYTQYFSKEVELTMKRLPKCFDRTVEFFSVGECHLKKIANDKGSGFA